MLKISKELNNYNLSFETDNFQISVHHITVETFDRIDGYDTHRHSSFEIHYIKSGRGEVEFSDRKYMLKPGDLYLCPPEASHKQKVYDNHMFEYAIRFDIKKVDNTINQTSENESNFILKLLNESRAKIFENQLKIENLFEKAFSEALYKKPGYYISIKQAIMSIIIEVARNYESISESDMQYDLPARDTNRYRMDIISRYIHDNLASKITTHDLAKHVFISERQLYRIIKKNTDLSTHQYIDLIRINYVKSLLGQKKYSLKNIADFSGYSSAFHLSKSFKLHTGLSPRQYLYELQDRLN